MMKVQRPVARVRREAPAQAVVARQAWRVFEYRRPPVPVRPRFTT